MNFKALALTSVVAVGSMFGSTAPANANPFEYFSGTYTKGSLTEAMDACKTAAGRAHITVEGWGVWNYRIPSNRIRSVGNNKYRVPVRFCYHEKESRTVLMYEMSNVPDHFINDSRYVYTYIVAHKVDKRFKY